MDLCYLHIPLGTRLQHKECHPRSGFESVSLLVTNLPVWFAVHGPLFPKCRDLDSYVFLSKRKIKIHTNVAKYPSTQYTGQISTYLHHLSNTRPAPSPPEIGRSAMAMLKHEKLVKYTNIISFLTKSTISKQPFGSISQPATKKIREKMYKKNIW